MAIKYENKYVCYIDILGFRDIIEKNLLTPQEIYGIIITALEEIKKSYNHKYVDLFYFSDTFVVMFDTLGNFDGVTAIILMILRLLWEAKIPTRGALTYGEVYYNKEKNILFGPAFIKAHDLEKKANFPHIIIDHEIKPIHNAKDGQYYSIQPSLLKNGEGFKFIKNQCEYFKQHNLNIYYKYIFCYKNFRWIAKDDPRILEAEEIQKITGIKNIVVI